MKGYLSSILYRFCPFFEFSGSIHGITSLNLLLYEGISFLLLVFLFSSILQVIKATTHTFESFLNMTIILGIPSKILGAVVGVIQNFIFLFIFLYFLSLPMLRLDMVRNSSFSNKILNSTPFLSQVCEDTLKVIEDFENLLDKYDTEPDRKQLNQETLQLFVDHDIVDVDTANHLIENGKLKYVEKVEKKEA